MTTSTHLLRRKRFLPLFCTQLLNAFNDNLYKTALILFVVYQVYNDPEQEFLLSAFATLLFMLPFFLLSALAGQLADMRDKAAIIRTVKLCEIGLMTIGAIGLFCIWQGIGPVNLGIGITLFALFLAGVQSTFLGPIKYSILPQHLKREEVLSGTGLVEAGTYVAILLGTILAGWINIQIALVLIMATALVGYATSLTIPAAPPLGTSTKIDFNIWRSSIELVKSTMHDRQIFFAIVAISFFWTIGAVLFIQFVPLAKNVLFATKEVASLFLVMFSIGVAIGSVSINALLKGKVSARFSPVSVLVMGGFVVGFYLLLKFWNGDTSNGLLDVQAFVAQPMAPVLLLTLAGIAIAGGMFVVPLYAFLTTRCEPDAASRTIAANNIVNSGAMVAGSGVSLVLGMLGVDVLEQVLMSAVMCVISAWLGYRLLQAERAHPEES